MESETVQCAGCSRRLVIDVNITVPESVPEDERYKFKQRVLGDLEKKYAPMVVDHHTPECHWRTTGCDGKFAAQY